MKEAKKVKILISMDLEYTEDFKTKKDYKEELGGVKKEILKNFPDLTGQIYSIKLKNQTVQNIICTRW